MKKKIVAIVILIAGVCVCLFSGYKIFVINREYDISEKFYSQQAEKCIKTEEKSSINKSNEKTVDFDKLKKINADICGWIDIPAITVSYPILQGENNDAYLHHLPDGTYNFCGSIFIDERCKNDFSSPVTVIYGHCMKDGSMFAKLGRFLDKSLIKNNGTFKIYTPDKTITAKILNCFEITKNSEIYNLPKNKLSEDYIKNFYSETGTDLSKIDTNTYNLVLLSTCSFSFESASTDLVAVIPK